MNKQKRQGSRGIEWTDYTWNPIGGCPHACRWTMPDGSIAKCYAEEQAESVRLQKHYPQGFNHIYFHPHRLEQPLKVKTPSKIFPDSMSDLMAHTIPEEQVNAVIDVMRKAHWHTFQLLTKAAPRLLKFEFPTNVWVGASVPSSSMMGKTLTPGQQSAMLDRTLSVLKQVNVPVKWMSIEPLSWNLAPIMEDCGLQWVVIGAASNGRKTYQPKREWVEALLEAMDKQNIPVFFKGNLEWTPWREEFPKQLEQPSLL